MRRELQLVAGVVGPESAERLLSARLDRRLTRQRLSQAPITDPVGWLIGRALPRLSNCYDSRCDEGTRLDTGAPCPACEALIADRRALRHSVAARLFGNQLLPEREYGRTERFEKALRREFASQQAHAAVLRGRATDERNARQAAVAARRAEAEAVAAVRKEAPCLDCGRQTAADVCGICSSWRAVEAAASEAGDVTRAVGTGDRAPTVLARVAERAAADVRAEAKLAASRGRAEGAAEETASCMAKLAAELTACEHRSAALDALAHEARADAEAIAAFEAELRRSHLHQSADDAQRAARAAAEAARLRTAEHLVAAALAERRARRRGAPQQDEADPYRVGAARVRAEIHRAKAKVA
ncbi:hypothetical protein ACIQF5_20770 [Streptomyces goshikiensis]|uniref:hypothetical protein n=1 Tax=Streptomyces goshikiensis TaxID=1942 RepID=UPI00380C892C